MAFGRRKNVPDTAADETIPADDPGSLESAPEPPAPAPRTQGPWDVTDDAGDGGAERLDLGGLRVLGTPGVDVQVQVDENTGNLAQLTFARPDSAVQVQPFAAPRSGGLWDDVRGQITASISSGGGLVEEAQGPFGIELRAQVKGNDASTSLQPARFVGVDGPRWFLRAVFLGAAARPGAAADALEKVVRSLVVVRGTEAMPVGAPIPMRLPATGAPADAPATEKLSPFVRGPEITEIR